MLKDNLQTDMITALKAKDSVRLDVLRFVISTIKYAEIEKKTELTDEEVTKLLQKEVKKREEALEMMKKSGRTELIDKEEKQLEILRSYLPKQMSDVDLEKIIDQVLAKNPEAQNPGPLIGQVMAQVKGQADGRRVASILTQKLQKK